ncbi:MarR family winged helix-turn-helix transcriptional regulator [Schlesneria sp. T3-172]|uniref:MarR family winged helix-turn-helix transcriptional regulator n=1 Tax=Schlesneria TaxID=656899 RepID=UPI002F0CCCB7
MAKSATSIETIATSCVAGRLRLLNRVVTNTYDDAMRPLGLKLTQFIILAVTARLGVARPSDVCKSLELDASTLSRTVERMVAKGWLEIMPDEDGRSHPFRLTEAGKRLMQQAIPAWEQAQTQAKTILGDEGLKLLDGAIHRIKSLNSPR